LYEKDSGITTVSAILPSVALKPFSGLKVQETSCTAEGGLARVFTEISKGQ
jgi:hypothetical protein